MNVFDLPGPQFLQFYIVLIAIGLPTAMVLRRALRGPHDDPSGNLQWLDAFQTAYLSGGAKGAVEAAIASLVHRGAVTVSSGQLTAHEPLLKGVEPFERAVYDAIARRQGTVANIRLWVQRQSIALAAPLERQQLILPQNIPSKAYLFPALLTFAIFAIGVIKIWVGLSRNRPVGFLVALCVITFLSTIGFFIPILRTVRGDRLLAALKQENSALELSVRTGAKNLPPADLALAVGLFGVAMLHTPPFEDLRLFLRPPNTGSGSGCSSGGCGGGGCGGGGCGGCGS